MKHTMQLTDQSGRTATLILREVNAVGLDQRCVVWTVKGRGTPQTAEFDTEDEARSAYAEINTALEAWHARSDKHLGADYRYEVTYDGEFCAHGKVWVAGDVLDYDPNHFEEWQSYIDAGLIKRVPR